MSPTDFKGKELQTYASALRVASPNTSTILTLPGQVHKTFLDVISHQLPEQAMFVLVQAAAWGPGHIFDSWEDWRSYGSILQSSAA